MIPLWFHILALAGLLLGISSALLLAGLELRRPERMAVMNWVWPLVALSGGPLVVWLYRRSRRAHPKFALAVAVATCHCGAGCTLGDLAAEGLGFLFPGLLAWFGLGSLFSQPMFAMWVLDFVAAFLLGVLFQYWSIAPMRHLDMRAGLAAALKADSLSLCAWQAGMYGAMALGQFVLARPAWGTTLNAGMPEFWFLMQAAMLAGFVTSYPVNWLLLRTGVKQPM